MIGRLAHIGFDLVLISGFLAGVKRATGVQPNLDLIENKDVRNYTGKFLGLGEQVLDSSAAFLGSSQFFTRK
ncbi:hypothetical protein FOB58_004358 [Candida parapsilosis]|uniref:DUF1748-domain-containing protein n=2 Tax=Candida parapsilosis TaxID=5480 RepID=G8BJ94_CANPC|nr:uncharacterized protein CPAR2_405130 [Candida parapsilosis]KAF6045921.1 hypothetical protein FOB58_004358 [Candida parapsilosis]KAF6046527.1 hypothetical protein FOB59_003992 [Candida parapsilosis]KAF6051032.1 hypothetical protein FOB60_003700 [Candida parapsilosis]KAF6062245.1 hypothetical protein FOB61_003675 [Candida parapsilosis]KAI5904893.1 hypothetical protein K4G60_g4051 [Candida parapsilosis]